MIITRATEYAIRALLHLSKQPRGQIVLKKDICAAQDITPAFLTKILQPLIKEGIVGSQRGVGGGFYLIKAPEEITLLDVVRAEEGPLYLNHCIAQEGICERDAFCPTHGAWKDIRNELMQTLAKYTFADLVATEARNLEKLGRSSGHSKAGC
ncbi:BadM/Rrf2 family transcriptional regulator [Geothermobacter ehrlichii]|uniref:BadM/Rrf2 family transcriptional regulator n=1 Tax=Geothermobacter ehrlichii TaxID=213224 RepID=A0A5D3WLV1_9BACT|nr:Rrf2 family transcriptional regulator [Geothermobacter ehrlichii]TYO98529.1 BadM/Rrf2 family transcriptional regulator [Geothermobacter ehrlichii]